MKKKKYKICVECGYSKQYVHKILRQKIINTVLIVLLLLTMVFIASKIIIQEQQKPFGYYDGTYICVNEEDYKNNMTPKQIIETHEYCHSLVRQQYNHFCSKGGFGEVFK